MSGAEAAVHIFGIRHHGPGSARSLRRALERLRPDAVLVEGPPDAEAILPLLAHPQMRPPVALLVYAPDAPRKAVYYPFAVFSPEWQAIHYGLTHGAAVRLMDLPQAHQLALAGAPEEAPTGAAGQSAAVSHDPLGELAKAAGFPDGESWWEHLVERRRDSADIFAAVLEAMAALREAVDADDRPDAATERLREAHMRKTVRAAQKEGFARIAVVCGAWHAPALLPDAMPSAKQDSDLLKGLPKIRVDATWVPWTHGRLTLWSGYGAGIWSPGWYQHLWETPGDVAATWLTKVAHLLRQEDLDASPAQVIDALRLTEALAALRQQPVPGLAELNEAALSVFCSGSDQPMRLIHRKLIVGETMGDVPDETPVVPLQQDLLREQRRLRLRPAADEETLDLDLRQPTHLERSHLLHRLHLLDVPWGTKERVAGKSGTFHEVWRLRWSPELTIQIIEKSPWGNTVHDAATAYARHAADTAPDLPALTGLVNVALQADLPLAVPYLVQRLEASAALTGDVTLLMAGLPALADVIAYGDVRRSDTAAVRAVVAGMVARVVIGLPPACASLADDAAEAMHRRLLPCHNALRLLQDADHLSAWHTVLTHLVDHRAVHGLLRGGCCRILFDGGVLAAPEMVRVMRLAVSRAEDPVQAAAWLRGFLEGSGLALLHHDGLLGAVDEWLTALTGDEFIALLPLLRRTFATFPLPERKQIGQRLRGARHSVDAETAHAGDVDETRAHAMLPILAEWLGIPYTGAKPSE